MARRRKRYYCRKCGHEIRWRFRQWLRVQRGLPQCKGGCEPEIVPQPPDGDCGCGK